MNRIFLAVLAFVLSTFCSAQSITFKKNVIIKNDVPIGKFEGKATLLKNTDVSILSTEGVPLLNVKDTTVYYHSPFYSPLRYYSVTFIPLKKKVAFVPPEIFFASERKLIEYLYYNIGQNFLDKDGFNMEVIDRFTASRRDQTKQIHEDTVNTYALIKASKIKVDQPFVVHNNNSEIKIESTLKRVTRQSWAETLQEFDVIQNGEVIAKITKLYSGDPGATTNTTVAPVQSVKYVVMRKVTPFELNGKTISFIPVYSLSGTPQFPEQHFECKYAGFGGKFSNIFAAEFDMVNWLISKGCI